MHNLQNVPRNFEIVYAQFANFIPKPDHNPNSLLTLTWPEP